MFKLKSLTLKNFMAFKEAFIDFSKNGLYIITGFNELGGDSNGSGKTCILSAISYALWGRTEEGLKKDQVVRWGATTPSSFVKLELIGPEGTYLIERTQAYTKLFLNDKQIIPEAWRKREIQDTINDTFKSDPKIFFSATMFDRNFAGMGDADRKELLKGILNLEALDVAYQKIRTKIDQLSTRATSLQIERDMLNKAIPQVEEKSERYKGKAETFEEDRQKEIEIIKDNLRNKVVYDVELAQSLKFTQEKEKRLQEQTALKITSSNQVLEDITSIKEAIANSNGKVHDRQNYWLEITENSVSAQCRLCGAPINKEQIDKLKNDITTSIQEEIKKQAALASKLEFLENDMIYTSLEDKDFAEVNKKVNELRVQVISMESKVEAWEETRKRLEKSLEEAEAAENAYADLYRQTTLEHKELEVKLEEAKALFGVVTKDIDIYMFLKWVFSREGVSSYIIERSFARLQSLANHYMSKVSKEGFRVHISPQKELKSKTLKEEIEIAIIQEGRKIPYAALSGGQKQRLNIALVVSMFKLCRDMQMNMFDFLLLDEILDLSLADKGQEDMVALLRLLLAEISQVVVISHKVGISQDFDYEIAVRRGINGVAKIV